MVFRRGKQDAKDDAGKDKPERISNKLDHTLIAESKRPSMVKRLMRHKRALIVAGAAVVLIVGVAVVAMYVTRQNTLQQRDEEFKTLMADVKDLRNQAKDGEARLRLERFDEKYPTQTEEQRRRVANELAVIYKTTGDYKNAVKWQQAAYDSNPNPGYSDYYALGEAYTMNRDNAQAIKYLQLALDALKAGDEQKGGPRSTFLQHQIDLLKGSGQ